MRIEEIIIIIIATSASVKCTNSALRFVKNVYWSKMSVDRLNSLVRMYAHKNIKLEYNDNITDMYEKCNPGRILFINPLGDK